jgi:hypothetical protein
VPCLAKILEHADPLKEIHGTGAQVFGAGFIPGEVAAIQQNDLVPLRSEPERGRAPRRARSDDQDV